MAAMTCVHPSSTLTFNVDKQTISSEFFGPTSKKVLVYEHVVQAKKRNIIEDDNNNLVEVEKAVKEEQVATRVEDSETKEYKWDIVWQNILVLGTLHVLALYGAYLRFFVYGVLYMDYPLIIAKILGVASCIGITAGYHRLWTHRCYKAKVPLEILLMFMATLTYQNSILDWARDHRVHHKFSDTDADPYNSKRGFFFSHCGWLLVRKHKDVIEKGKTVDMSDLTSNPVVMFQHKYYYYLVFLFAFVLPVTLGCMSGGPIWHAFCCMACYKFILSVNLTWCINSVAHMYGTKPYDSNIAPTEATFMKVLGFGEGFHNYHHSFPWDYKASEFANDSRNSTTWFIDLFAKIGWAYDMREVNPKMLAQRQKRTGGPGHESHMKDGSPSKLLYNLWHAFLLLLFIYVA